MNLQYEKTVTKESGWPFNQNAVGAIIGSSLVATCALLDWTPGCFCGIALLMIWCTKQICEVIRDTAR